MVSHRRQVHVILHKTDGVQLKMDGFDYVVFVSSGTFKCFGCGGEGHLVRACPEKGSCDNKTQSEEARVDTVSQSEQDSQVMKTLKNTNSVSEKEEQAVVQMYSSSSRVHSQRQ